MSETPLVTLDAVTKKYADFELGPLTATIPRGYITAIVGPGGAGKTTLHHLITGLAGATSGIVTVAGQCVSPLAGCASGVATVRGDADMLIDESSAHSYAQLCRRVDPAFDTDLFEELLGEWSIPDDTDIKDLSRGQRVSLQLVVALARKPQLLLLDEPTGGLDPTVRTRLYDTLRSFVEDPACGVIMSTHISEDVTDLADYVMVLCGGSLLAHDDTETFLDGYRRIAGSTTDDLPERHKILGLRSTNFGYTAIAPIAWTTSHADALAAGGHEAERATLHEILSAISQAKRERS